MYYMDHLVEHELSIKPYHKHAIPVPQENEPVLVNNDHHCCQLQLVQTAGSKYETQSVKKNDREKPTWTSENKKQQLELKQRSILK